MINIRKLRSEDIPAVVVLHRKAISYSLNARLGKRHLSRIYKFVNKSEIAVVNIAEIDGKVVGAISATINSEKLSTEIIKSFSQKLLLATNLIIRPWLLYNVLEQYQLSLPVIYDNLLINSCLASIAVAPEYRGQGIGKKLVASVEDYFKSQNIKFYRLDTFKTNTNAQAFYKKLGFVELKRKMRSCILIKAIK